MGIRKLIHVAVILLVLMVGMWRIAAHLHQQFLNRQFIRALDRGDAAGVQTLLRRGADVNMTGTFYGFALRRIYRSHGTLLQVTFNPRHPEIANLLKQAGARQ